MTTILSCANTETTTTSTRSASLALRLERGVQALIEFARPLSDVQWRTPVPGDGRSVGVVVHHVASVFPLEIQLAQTMAGGTPIVSVVWQDVHEMNAAHAAEHANVSKQEALDLLAANGAAAAAAIRRFTDSDLERAVTVSLYAHAELTSQFMLEDHAVRHSYHHLAKIRGALGM